ncbi:hypothetical protein [Poritiphilus flavus]|uniref:Uncharacterized protein n=1 Tax=Poritiphilus flavus TaxID=2697053 RepID=A0A6L9EHA6_9FLAO|nr:hypothetical protein [Poritiphilus flavus]NAS14043.1 hypothetical protein [Poritiphilus flavus]
MSYIKTFQILGIRRLLMLTFLFLSVVVFNSCSTDSENGTEITENNTEDDNDANEDTDAEQDDPGPQGSIELEDGFTVDEDRMFSSMIVSAAEYQAFLEGNGDLQMVSNKVYQYFEDDFDFIFILSVEEEQPSGLYYGRSSSAQSGVSGLGSSLWDNTAAYGSAGKLKSLIHMPRTEYVRNGPFLHEIAHYWANHGFIATTVGGHWGYSSAGGQLGGFDALEDLGGNTYRGLLNGQTGFGTFANGGNSVPYGNLELYTMGLIEADDLETVMVAENPQSTAVFGEFTADAITEITAAQLIAQHGERLPSAQDAQKAFTGIVVVLSTEALSQSKREQLTADMESFTRQGDPDDSWGNSYNFWRATFEMATLSARITDEQIK